MEEREHEKIRKVNCKSEWIYRKSNETHYKIPKPVHVTRTLYPWESETKFPRITKDFFRCRGNPLNPSVLDLEGQPISDCEGGTRHGLPVIHGQEGIYPILIDLLNFVQKKTGKRVVITCGHRCPVHNTFADPSKENLVSKHQIGAEVDFYVQGMEERSPEIVGLIMQYFQENDIYKNDKEAIDFKRFEKTDLSIQPWYNKEIFIKLFQRDEGRDLDNRHPHSYICLQVRFDKVGQQKVTYEWAKAHQGYRKAI